MLSAGSNYNGSGINAIIRLANTINSVRKKGKCIKTIWNNIFTYRWCVYKP